jgi:hypothetical protein
MWRRQPLIIRLLLRRIKIRQRHTVPRQLHIPIRPRRRKLYANQKAAAVQAATKAVVPPSIINRFIIRAVEVAETSRAVAVGNLLEGVAANPSQLQRRRSRIGGSADNADNADSADNNGNANMR